MDIQIEQKKGLKKKHIPFIVGGVVLLLAIVWIIFGNHASKLNVEASRISVQAVTKGEFNDYVRVSGQVQPINTIQLSAIEGGMVEAKMVEEGAEVKKGDVIVRLSNPMLNLNILDSEAQLAEKQNFLRNTQVTMEQDKLTLKKEKLQLDLEVTRKQRKYEQYKKLYDESLASKEDYLQAKEDYEFAVNGILFLTLNNQLSTVNGIFVILFCLQIIFFRSERFVIKLLILFVFALFTRYIEVELQLFSFQSQFVLLHGNLRVTEKILLFGQLRFAVQNIQVQHRVAQSDNHIAFFYFRPFFHHFGFHHSALYRAQLYGIDWLNLATHTHIIVKFATRNLLYRNTIRFNV